MPERVTRVRFVAEASNYIAGVETMARKTRELGTASEKLAAQRQGYDTLGRSALAFGTVAAASVAFAVARFAEFDAAMSNVQAATQESAENMDLLRDAALDAGATTVFTAVEAANAVEELGKAGLSTQQILNGGLKGALALASAGQLNVAEAASIAAIAVKQFNLEGGDVPHVADLLAAGAGKAVGDVRDLGAALGQAGLVANAAGQSIEDTTGVLAAFADAGLLGSDAGTSLKSAIIALQAPTEKSKKVMDDYNLSFYDGQGAMLSFDEIAGQLESKLGGLTDEQRNAALATIFGNDALRAANVLYDEGASGISKYVDQTNDAGYAAQVAADRLNNLQGDIEKLGGSFDTALIKSGSGANDILRELTQNATFLVDAIGGAPKPVLDAGLAIGTVVGAVGLTGGAALTAVPRIADFRAGLDALKVSGRGAALGIGAAGLAIGVATIAIGTLITQIAESDQRSKDLADSLDQLSGATTDYTRQLVVQRLEEKGAYESARELGLAYDTVTDAALGNKEAMAEVANASGQFKADAGDTANILAQIGNAFGMRTPGELANQVTNLNGELEEGRDSWRTTRDAVTDAGSEMGVFGEKTSTATDEVTALRDALANFGNTQLQAESAQRALEAAIDDATGSVKENGRTLDDNTAKGRANNDALAEVIRSTNAAAAAAIENGATQDEVNSILDRGREAYVNIAGKAGLAEAKARDYAKAVIATPEQVTTAFKVTGISEAQGALDGFIRRNDGRVVTVNADYVPRVGEKIARASGGILPGPPSSTDNMLIHAASGEFVVNAAATQRNRAVLEQINNGGIPAYANGGLVAANLASSMSAQPSAPPVIYVQNPFTGEYVRAEIAGVAQRVVNRSQADLALDINAGGVA